MEVDSYDVDLYVLANRSYHKRIACYRYDGKRTIEYSHGGKS